MSDFKVGDRVRLEGVISRLWGEGGAWVNFTGSNEETGITREEMAHAKLLEPARKPRYDWSNIPPEYEWVATDKNGTVYAYKNKPFCKDHANFWIGKDSGDMFLLCAGQQITKDWRDSLEQRPDVAPEHDIEAHTHITPCKGTNCGSMNGAHSPECEAEHVAAITGCLPVENNVLDLSKPVQFKYYPDRKIKAVYGPTSINTYMVEEEKGVINMYMGEVLENIPEPKKTTSQEVYLHEHTGGFRFFSGHISRTALISKARITHTSGEGWSIEEVK